MNATTLPDIKPEFKAIALDTVEKKTEKYEEKYYAKVEFTVDYGYGETKTYAVGDEVGGLARKEGLQQYGGKGALIPWNQITVKTFCTVREYKTTVFEIVKK